MKRAILLGIVLIIIGAAMLGFGQFSYKTREKVFEIGPIKATEERTKTVRLPPILGWAFIGCGTVVLIFGVTRPKV